MPTPSDPTPSPWRSRGYLPHFDQNHTVQSITFRLADSLPKEKLQALETELLGLSPDKRNTARRLKIEDWLDSGIGCCVLGNPAMAKVMQETLLQFDGDRYHLIAWCIMPNHVHVLIETIAPLAKIVQSWKSYTGRWAMQRLAELGLSVPRRAIWMREYWDRYIRDANHFDQALNYIHQNPVKARLCKSPKDWQWSSAKLRP